MRAVVQRAYGPPEDVLELATFPVPALGDDDVLVRVRAASVNTPDWLEVLGVPYVLRLQFGLRQPSAPVRDTDLAGVVEAVGSNVADIRPGDEVFGSSGSSSRKARAGTFAEYAVAPASSVLLKPADVSFEEAAASVMSGLTALIAVRDVGRVGAGTKVLVNGASGGVGTFAVQMARHLGAEVTGVCSGRNVDLVRSLGADHVVDYTQDDFTRSSRRYDVVLDNVLNRPPARVAGVLTPGGVLIPNSVGDTDNRWLAGLPRMAKAALRGLGRSRVKFASCVVDHENLADLAALLASGDVRAIIDTVYPLAEAPRAVERMLGHHARGNVVITADA